MANQKHNHLEPNEAGTLLYVSRYDWHVMVLGHMFYVGERIKNLPAIEHEQALQPLVIPSTGEIVGQGTAGRKIVKNWKPANSRDAQAVALTYLLRADMATGANAFPSNEEVDRNGACQREKENDKAARNARTALVLHGWLEQQTKGGRAGGAAKSPEYRLTVPVWLVKDLYPKRGSLPTKGERDFIARAGKMLGLN